MTGAFGYVILLALVLLAGCGDGTTDRCGLTRVAYECFLIAGETRSVVLAGEECADISTEERGAAFRTRLEATANARLDAGPRATYCLGRPLGPCDPTCPVEYDAGTRDRYPYCIPYCGERQSGRHAQMGMSEARDIFPPHRKNCSPRTRQ